MDIIYILTKNLDGQREFEVLNEDLLQKSVKINFLNFEFIVN